MLNTLIKVIFSLIFVVLFAAFYTLFTLDLNDYKKEIESAVYDSTGRQLHLEGDVSLAWSPIPTLAVEKATLSNADWAAAENMVTLEAFELRLALYPLLKKQLQITKIFLNQPVISLETDSEGLGNWTMGQQEATQSDSASPFEAVVINEIDIEQAKINYVDGVSGETKQLEIELFSVDVSNVNDPFSVLFNAVYEQIPLELSGELGGLNALLNNQLSQVNVTANLGGIELGLHGEVALPHQGKGLDMQVSIASNDIVLAELSQTDMPAFGDIELAGKVTTDLESELLSLDLQSAIDGAILSVNGDIEQPQLLQGIALNVALKTDSTTLSQIAETEIPAIGDLYLAGLVLGGGNDFAVESLQLTAGESDFAGNITIALSAEKPVINAELYSDVLDLTFLESSDADSNADKAVEDETERLFSDEPIILASLKQLNARLDYKAETISSAGLDLNDIDVHVELDNGHLAIKPLQFAFAGSKLTSEFALNASDDLAEVVGKLQVNGFKLSEIAAMSDTISGGNTDVYMQIKGEGATVRQLMAGLDGQAIVKVAESQIADGTLDILGADFLAELAGMLNPFSEEKAGTELACAVVNFTIRDGIATAKKGIAIQTDKLNIVGDGTINLKNEEIDISIKPEPRTGIGVNISQLASLVKVGGTLANPGAEVDAAAVLTTGVSGAAAVATGGISVVAKGLLDRTTADQNPCDTALGIKQK